jgi:hypothetical protein
MTTCKACGQAYSPPNTGNKMPESTPEWKFLCWTPGHIESAVFIHNLEACRDALHAELLSIMKEAGNRSANPTWARLYERLRRLLRKGASSESQDPPDD